MAETMYKFLRVCFSDVIWFCSAVVSAGTVVLVIVFKVVVASNCPEPGTGVLGLYLGSCGRTSRLDFVIGVVGKRTWFVPQNWFGVGYFPLVKNSAMMASVQSECSAKEV